MGLDKAPVEFQKLVFLRPPNLDVCDDHLPQNPDDKEIGYSNVLDILGSKMCSRDSSGLTYPIRVIFFPKTRKISVNSTVWSQRQPP